VVYRGVDAKSMAQTLLDQFGGLSPLLAAAKKDFCRTKGLGEAKYCQLQASLELTKRYLNERLTSTDVFSSPDEVMDYLAVQIRDYHREVFVMLSLDSKHRLIEFNELFQGTINSASIYPREVCKMALQKNATPVIVAHNHPSGNAEPSKADISITKKLKAALDILDIKLLDHFVIGKGEIVSLGQLGKL
jgi:DNA repair protein RadC